jgi:ribonuclease BN (tRNA processing enzyme)
LLCRGLIRSRSIEIAPGIDRLVARIPNAATLKQSILSHHTTAEDAGRVAQAAGVKTLVLSHFVPADDPAITDQMWIDKARESRIRLV